ncbi:MAG TPA: RluA family pseudouridine synthase [Planctomycetaceae bacterium]|nr:RluA family pseudouridine synthase [Planctomycetaceae bacterium]
MLVNGIVEIHDARRLKADDVVVVGTAGTSPLQPQQIEIVYVDGDLVVVEKPPHVVTTRRPEEQRWPLAKRQLAPTLDELTAAALAPTSRTPRTNRHGRKSSPTIAPLFRVQRLDRETSGLVVFARTPDAAKRLIEQFTAHTVERVYFAVVNGKPDSQTVSTALVRDRGDGLRGSSRDGKSGQSAVTHLKRLNSTGPLSLVECRLETGRTHQIRIHLCELGTPVCGEPVYTHRLGEAAQADESGAPRLALHAARLGFRHPITEETKMFTSMWPQDLAVWTERSSGLMVALSVR